MKYLALLAVLLVMPSQAKIVACDDNVHFNLTDTHIIFSGPISYSYKLDGTYDNAVPRGVYTNDTGQRAYALWRQRADYIEVSTIRMDLNGLPINANKWHCEAI